MYEICVLGVICHQTQFVFYKKEGKKQQCIHVPLTSNWWYYSDKGIQLPLCVCVCVCVCVLSRQTDKQIETFLSDVVLFERHLSHIFFTYESYLSFHTHDFVSNWKKKTIKYTVFKANYRLC